MDIMKIEIAWAGVEPLVKALVHLEGVDQPVWITFDNVGWQAHFLASAQDIRSTVTDAIGQRAAGWVRDAGR